MKHEPRGFLGDAEGAMHLVRANAVLAVGEHPEAWQPLPETDRRILEHGPDLYRKLLPTRPALPNAASLEEQGVGAATVRARHAIGPAEIREEVERNVRVREVPDGAAQRFGIAVPYAPSLR
jgi:hypothetical protein